jgi:hypothetical protein
MLYLREPDRDPNPPDEPVSLEEEFHEEADWQYDRIRDA